MAKARRLGLLLGWLTFASVAGMVTLGSPVAGGAPYPLPPGYIGSYDQGYNTMAPEVGTKYFFGLRTDLSPVCHEELRIAQSKIPPENADGFLAGCIDAARHGIGIYYPCDRFGNDPVCPRRP
jgi:hypothetical protein